MSDYFKGECRYCHAVEPVYYKKWYQAAKARCSQCGGLLEKRESWVGEVPAKYRRKEKKPVPQQVLEAEARKRDQLEACQRAHTDTVPSVDVWEEQLVAQCGSVGLTFTASSPWPTKPAARHWMIDFKKKRVLNYYPSTLKWWSPVSGERGEGTPPGSVVDIALGAKKKLVAPRRKQGAL